MPADFTPWQPDPHSNHDQWPRRNWALKLMLEKTKGAPDPRPKAGADARREQGWRVLRVWETDILADPAAAAERICQALYAIH